MINAFNDKEEAMEDDKDGEEKSVTLSFSKKDAKKIIKLCNSHGIDYSGDEDE